jgi:hypothetical protein
VARSLFIIHLVGELAGVAPEPAPVRALQERHPDLLDRLPDLREALEQGLAITYTQWELYLAFYHGRGHSGPALDQGDVARKAMRSFLHFRVDPEIDGQEPPEEAKAKAWTHRKEIVHHLVEAIKHPNPRDVPVTDPANTAAWIAGVRSAANRWKVNLATIAAIAAQEDKEVSDVAKACPSPQTLYDEAFTKLALGDYTASRFWARRAANLALELLQEQPMDEALYRDAAQNALLLLHEAATAACDIPCGH